MTRRQAICALTALPARAEPSGLSYLRMDVQRQTPIEQQWPALEMPIAPGSLLKPFVALAYQGAFPTLICSRCWKPDGHGRLSLPEAIAYSCNSYFLQLARSCAPDDINRVAQIYGLPAPEESTPETWIGFGAGWKVTPQVLTRAYCELTERRSTPAAAQIFEGMRLSARKGTARALHADAFTKTGTGPCIHAPRGSGDGYAVAIYPTDSPRRVVLGTAHDLPGSETARLLKPLVR